MNLGKGNTLYLNIKTKNRADNTYFFNFADKSLYLCIHGAINSI